MELALIDFGAEDISMTDGVVHVVTAAAGWVPVRDFLKEKGCSILSAGLAFVPKQKVSVDEEHAEKVAKFIETIEEDDDVSEVYSNAEM